MTFLEIFLGNKQKQAKTPRFFVGFVLFLYHIYTFMKRSAGFLLLVVSSFLSFGQPLVTIPPDKIYGKLFVDVQMNRVFSDGKTFVDCVPKRKPAEIVADYETAKAAPGFDLKKFVLDNFEVPAAPTDSYKTNVSEDVVTHIRNLWTVLKRSPDKSVEGSSLL